MTGNNHSPLKFYHFSAYGIASIGTVAVEMLLQLYLFDFYTRVLGLSPILAGGAFAIAIVWDAVSDIVVSAGLLYARKHKLLYTTVIFFGAVVLAVSIYALFAVGLGESQWRLFIQLLLAYVCVNTGMTLIDLPQTSMSSELSPHSDERNKLLGFRLGMSIIGLTVGSALPGLLLKNDSNAAVAASRSDSGELVAIMVIVSSILTVIGLRNRDRSSTEIKAIEMPTFKEAFAVLRQKAFSQIVYASLIASVGRTINAALALMYYRLVLNLSEESVTQIIFPVFTLSIVVSIPFWTQLSKRYGKARPAWISVALLGMMGIVAYPVLPVGMVWPVLLVSIIGGILCGSVFLIDSMITDLIDLDEKMSGKRKESLFFAIQKSAVKIARAIAFIFIGGCLELFDLDVADKTAGSFEKAIIVAFFAFAVGLCFIVSSFFLRKTEIAFQQNQVNGETL
ncbi:MAG: GPH family glycoside/pentoside/hexuronide:cation symporter [Candidatus Pelagisphaera sp.]|jgi:GPH family glycoside/pentoside/hexuronide:cation symporter